MNGPAAEGGLFLIQVLFDFFIILFMLRVLLQLVGANFYNPLTQFVVRLTEPVLKPMRRLVPTARKVDLAVLVTLVIFTLIKLALLVWLQYKHPPHLTGLLLWALADLLRHAENIFFFALLVEIILSWIAPMSRHPVREVVHQLTAPVMNVARRVIPPIGGIDLSPIPILLGLKLIEIVVVHPMMQTGAMLALAGH